MSTNVLFIGGTGIISSGCSPLVIERGMNLFLFNRGTSFRETPKEAKIIVGDINKDGALLQKTIEENHIDVVVNWIVFKPEDVQRDIDLLKGKIKQYVFISSASAYQKPIAKLPITEETPLDNPFWQYSRNKAACERLLMEAHKKSGFPVTIVRPSHTYDKTLLPFSGGYTNVARMKKGLPVVIHGDGSSLWVLTHHKDFAVGFVGLLGKPEAIGEAFHITSDELLSWNAIYRLIAEAAGLELKPIYIPSTVIAKYDPDFGAGLLGDKAHSVIFNNSKIKRFVPEYKAEIPFSAGAKEITSWYEAHPERQTINETYNALMEKMIRDFAPFSS